MRGAGGDGDVAVGGDLGQKGAVGDAVGDAAAVSPDDDGELFIGGRGDGHVDCVLGEGFLGRVVL